MLKAIKQWEESEQPPDENSVRCSNCTWAYSVQPPYPHALFDRLTEHAESEHPGTITKFYRGEDDIVWEVDLTIP